MRLQEFHQRRARVLQIMSVLGNREAWLGNVELRNTPTRSPGKTTHTVTPTDDGKWRGDYWYSEAAGNRSIHCVVAATPEKVLDWVWWSCTKDYREKFVAPAALQYDREVRRIKQALLQDLLQANSVSDKVKSQLQSGSRPHWSDEWTNPLVLGLAALMLARSPSATAVRLARNPHTPRGALAAMASHGVPAVKWQSAGNPATRGRALRRLRSSRDFGVRWYLASRGDTPTEEIVAWAAEDPALWSSLLTRPDLTPSQLDDLDAASSGALRRRTDRHPARSLGNL